MKTSILIALLIASIASTATAAERQQPVGLSAEGAINWIASMSNNGAPATLCAAAHYYYAHPSEVKKEAWKLWLQRGLELSKTAEEKQLCEAVKDEINRVEAVKKGVTNAK